MFIIFFLLCYFFLFFSFGWVEHRFVFFFDVLTCPLLALTFWISALIILCRGRLKLFGQIEKFFCLSVYILCVVLILCFSFRNFFFFFVSFEFRLIPTLIIILGWGYQPERLQAGMYIIMYTITASLPLLIFLLWWGGSCGHFFIFFEWGRFHYFGVKELVFLFCSIGAFLVKLPVFFFHLWLPKAHVEAPVSGSIILAGVLLKLGGYGLFRVFCLFNFYGLFFFDFLIVFFLWGGVITRLICLRQVDLKRLVAYSSIGHMGIMVSGLFTACAWGWRGALIIMVGHGVCSPCLFVLARLGYDLYGSRRVYLVKGVLRFLPSLSLWWFLFVAANIAGPPTINLGSELFLIMSLLTFSWWLFIFLGVMRFLAGAYSLYLFTSFNHGRPLESFGVFSALKFTAYLSFFLHFFPLYFFFLFFDLFIMI